MGFRCPESSKHKSESRDVCSVCGALINLAVHSRINPAPAKGKSKSSSRKCLNCGANLDTREPVCAQCGCQYFGIDNLPLEPEPPPPPTPPGEILEKVLRKQSGSLNAMPMLQAMLSIDRRRRECRPVDDPEPAGPARLVFTMDAEFLPFGRVSEWMEIHDMGVSRAHGEFVRQPDGSYCIRDCGSANGVVVNGTRLRPDELRKIKPGDEIIIGFWHMIQITWGT